MLRKKSLDSIKSQYNLFYFVIQIFVVINLKKKKNVFLLETSCVYYLI